MTRPVPYSHRTHTQTERTVDGRTVPARERSVEMQQRVDEWNANNPTIATPFGQENLARSRIFDSVRRIDDFEAGVEMYVDRFTEDPDLMWLLVGDMVRYVSSEETPRGERVSSRRKVQGRDRNLQAVWDIIGPRYSMEPFPVAVLELIGERSQRAFATRCGFGSGGQTTLRRYIKGERPLNMPALEAIAKAGRVSPFYFIEFRALWLAQELMRAMLARPNVSVAAVKKVQAAVV